MLIPNEEIERVMQEVVDRFLIPKFLELGMNATGEWVRSLEVVGRDGQKGAIRGRHYSQWLAKGRAPGGRPPISVIEKWVNAKLGIGGAQGLGVAFAVANKIAKEGTSWYPNGTDLLEVLQSREVIDFVNNEFKLSMQVYIKRQLQRNIKEVFA